MASRGPRDATWPAAQGHLHPPRLMTGPPLTHPDEFLVPDKELLFTGMGCNFPRAPSTFSKFSFMVLLILVLLYPFCDSCSFSDLFKLFY